MDSINIRMHFPKKWLGLFASSLNKAQTPTTGITYLIFPSREADLKNILQLKNLSMNKK